MISPGNACGKSVIKREKYGKNGAMNWIYLSPHLDDAALSCGGLIWEQAQSGETVSIWTLCAGESPAGPLSPFAETLHARWQTGPQALLQRRQEDIAACQVLSAAYRHFSIPDCIYRRAGDWQPLLTGDASQEAGEFLYASEEALTSLVHPAETGLIGHLREELAQALPAGAQVICPLALGGHVDHRLTRAAAQGLVERLWYYADYPYVVRHPEQLEQLRQEGWEAAIFPISPAGLEAWMRAVAAYSSQISTFWPDLPAMEAAIGNYCKEFGGEMLLKPGDSR